MSHVQPVGHCVGAPHLLFNVKIPAATAAAAAAAAGLPFFA
jgi:hypothetical protein